MRIDGHTASRGFDCPKCEQHVTAKDFEEKARAKYKPSSAARSENSDGVGHGYPPYGPYSYSPPYYYDPYFDDPYYYDYYYGWFWSYPTWYDSWGYYPFLLANGKATLEINLNSVEEEEFNEARSTFVEIPIATEKNDDDDTGCGGTIDGPLSAGVPSKESTSTPTGYSIRTATLSGGREYACVVSQRTGNPICSHYVDKEALVRWIQHPQRKRDDPRCPVCRSNANV